MQPPPHWAWLSPPKPTSWTPTNCLLPACNPHLDSLSLQPLSLQFTPPRARLPTSPGAAQGWTPAGGGHMRSWPGPQRDRPPGPASLVATSSQAPGLAEA